MTFGPVPIVLAVSGHRDLLEAEIPVIRRVLRSEFSTLRKCYPHSRLQLLNGLAEGADWIAAEVALECGLELVAVLPLPQAEYEKDFSTSEAVGFFRSLLSRSSRIQSAPFNQTYAGSSRRDEHYQALGIFLAEHAQCLYALWDGNTVNPLPGGTADVVQQCIEGITSPDNPLAQPETCQVKHLCCNRRKNPQAYPFQDVGTWRSPKGTTTRATDNYWEGIFDSIEYFNKAALHIESTCAGEVNQSRQWLTAGNPYPSVVEDELQAYALADALARNKQKLRHRALWFLSLLVFLSVFFQQLHLGPDMQWYWLALHIGFGLCAFGGYLQVFSRKHNDETQYMDWRALAEGLRVQTFWRAAGLKERASDYYLNSQRDELDWIRHAMRNVADSSTETIHELNIAWIKQRWLADQRNFFLSGGSSAKKKQCKLHRWTLASRSLFGIGAIATAALLIAPLVSLSTTVISWVALVAAVFFLMAAVCRNYANLMAYEEDSNRYLKMGLLFERALELLENFKKTNDAPALQKLLLAVGKEALAENGEWLQLHRQRKFEIPT